MKWLLVIQILALFLSITNMMNYNSIFADDMEKLIQEITTNHPEIKALDYAYISKKADAEHSDAYPDLKIGLAYRNYPYNRQLNRSDNSLRTPAMTGIEYTVSQEIPFPGKLTLQKKVATLGVVEFSHFKRAEKNKMVQELLVNLIILKNTEKRIAQYEEMGKITESLEKISKSSYSSGSVSLSKVFRNKINYTQLKDKILSIKTERDAILASLEYYKVGEIKDTKTLIDSNIDEYIEKLDNKIQSKTIDELTIEARQSPDYKLSLSSMEKAKQEEILNKITHLPDTEVFFSYMKRRNQNFVIDQGPLNYQIMDTTEFRGDLFSMGLTMRVPSWSLLKHNSLSEKGESNTKSIQNEESKRKLSIETNIKKLISNYKNIKDRIELVQTKLIPEINQTISSTNATYQSGKIELSEVLSMKLELILAKITELELFENKQVTIVSLVSMIDWLIAGEN